MSTDRSTPVISLSGPTMGTRFAVQLASGAVPDTTALSAALQSAVDTVDQQMSPWIATSDLNRLNTAAIGTGVPIPRQFMQVLTQAMAIETASGGAFSPIVGRNVTYWGFSAAKPFDGAKPGAARAAKSALHVDADRAIVTKRKPVEIDLCGIAKGYGVDELAAVLHDFGVQDFVASIDGELTAAGNHPDGTGWSIALEAPDPTKRRLHRVLECRDLSLATSGGYRHFRQNHSQNITHTIDPSSGQPCSDITTSVTVAAQRCAFADAWATALLVLGPQDGPALAKREGLNALFLSSGQTLGSGAFSELTKDEPVER